MRHARACRRHPTSCLLNCIKAVNSRAEPSHHHAEIHRQVPLARPRRTRHDARAVRTPPSNAKARHIGRALDLSLNHIASPDLPLSSAIDDYLTLRFFRGFLPAVGNNLILNVLAFVERAQARPFHGRDMHEHIFAAALRLDKAITLGRVEPLYSASSHISLQVVSRSPKPTNAGVTFALGMIPIPEIALRRYPGSRFR